LAQIARNALLELCPAPLYLRAREVPVAVVHRLELAAIDGNARCRKQTHLAAELDKARAHLADGTPIVLPEIGDRFVVGDKTAKQPHHLEVTAGLALKPPARLHPIEVAVNVKLQENRGMIGRPPRQLRFDPYESQFEKIERLDESVDHTNRIILVDPGIRAAMSTARDPCPRQSASSNPPQITSAVERESQQVNHRKRCVFTQPGSNPSLTDRRRECPISPKAGLHCAV